MTRYLTHTLDEDGWTEWIHPLNPYKFRCCDCGLVHNLEFAAVSEYGDDLDGVRVVFRAKRNERATAATRRKK